MSNPDYLPNANDVDGWLTQVIEEASEVIQSCCKIRRFGWDNWHPNDPSRTTNRAILYSEMEDLRAAMTALALAKGGGDGD